MKKSLLLMFLISLALTPALRRASASQETRKSEAAQSQSASEHFAKDGLSFDYSTGWKLTDKSTEAAQHLILSREGSLALIMVIAYRDILTNSGQMAVAMRAKFTPTTLCGQPVKVSGVITYNFVAMN